MPARGESMIERVVEVLESFKGAGGPLTASEIARKTAIPMPSAHRIVAELVDVGFLEREPDRRLRIGTRLWEVVARSSSALTLREVALPYMEDLRAAVRTPTLLSVLDRNDVLNLETLSTRQPGVTNVTQPGVRLPALASSPGIVLVAFSPPEVREHILATGKITRFTEHTVVDRADLQRIVNETRRTGYVVARRWIALDSTAVAVPILADDGTAIGALSVTTAFGADAPSTLLPALHATALGISRATRTADGPRLALLKQQIRHATEVP
jgi:DNA-binding IclR family transcriptional regulator